MKKQPIALWALIVLLLLALVAVGAYKLQPLLNPEVAATAPVDLD